VAELDPTGLPEIPATAGERNTLVAFLDYFRAVFLRKVVDLDEDQVRERAAASAMDLLGMTRHLADVERWWFRGVFTAEVDTAIYESDDDPDLDWHHGFDDTLADALHHWHREVERAREIVAATPDLDTVGQLVTERRGAISLRWIVVHMIEEYARHCGHADLIREVIDGTTGD
jgi:uncharacterized damage-inducible protein DinB